MGLKVSFGAKSNQFGVELISLGFKPFILGQNRIIPLIYLNEILI